MIFQLIRYTIYGIILPCNGSPKHFVWYLLTAISYGEKVKNALPRAYLKIKIRE